MKTCENLCKTTKDKGVNISIYKQSAVKQILSLKVCNFRNQLSETTKEHFTHLKQKYCQFIVTGRSRPFFKKRCSIICHKFVDMQTCRFADLQISRFVGLQACTFADQQTCRICRLADLQTCRLVDLQTGRPANNL